MGAKWCRQPDAAGTRAPTISEREVLTLCEDGDLLLMRERVVHAKLRVTMDQQVAQDITRFQQGEFPTSRVTQLQAWTGAPLDALAVSCALLLRLSGVLHLLEVTGSGLRLLAFAECVAGRVDRRDVYAIRRLQHVRTEQMAKTLRQIAVEVSQSSPIQWTQESPSPPVPPSSPPPSPRSLPHSSPSKESLLLLRDALAACPTLFSTLQRACQLCHHSHEAPSLQPQTEDVSAQLATAVVVAVYERLGLTRELDTHSSSLTPMLPSYLYSKTEPASARIPLTPPTALGVEMRLA